MRQHDESDAAAEVDDVLKSAAEELRRPLRIDAALFDARVMDEVHRGAGGFRERMARLARPRTFRVSPLTALAATLVFAVAIGAEPDGRNSLGFTSMRQVEIASCAASARLAWPSLWSGSAAVARPADAVCQRQRSGNRNIGRIVP